MTTWHKVVNADSGRAATAKFSAFVFADYFGHSQPPSIEFFSQLSPADAAAHIAANGSRGLIDAPDVGVLNGVTRRTDGRLISLNVALSDSEIKRVVAHEMKHVDQILAGAYLGASAADDARLEDEAKRFEHEFVDSPALQKAINAIAVRLGSPADKAAEDAMLGVDTRQQHDPGVIPNMTMQGRPVRRGANGALEIVWR